MLRRKQAEAKEAQATEAKAKSKASMSYTQFSFRPVQVLARQAEAIAEAEQSSIKQARSW